MAHPAHPQPNGRLSHGAEIVRGRCHMVIRVADGKICSEHGDYTAAVGAAMREIPGEYIVTTPATRVRVTEDTQAHE